MAKSPAALLIDGSGNQVTIVQDGASYRLVVQTKVSNASGSTIDPATEGGNLASIKAKTDSIPSDPAREGGNLATLAGKDFATQTTLTAIKDTDGIKKIFDPLPAGTNNIGDVDIASALPTGTNQIGKVAQGDAGAHVQRWMMGLSDGSGFISPATDRVLANAPFSFRLSDGSNFYDGVKTGQLPAALVGGRVDSNTGSWLGSTAPSIGQKAMAASLPVVFASDQTALNVNVVSVSGVATLVTDYLQNGVAYNMKVNGSVTHQVFTYNADPTKDISVYEIRFVFSAASFNWSGVGFGKNASSGLANGILVELIVNNGTLIVLNNIKINEDFLRTFGEVPVIEAGGSTVVLVSSFRFGGSVPLKAGTADKVRVTIRDDLTGGTLGVNYLTATFFGDKAA